MHDPVAGRVAYHHDVLLYRGKACEPFKGIKHLDTLGPSRLAVAEVDRLEADRHCSVLVCPERDIPYLRAKKPGHLCPYEELLPHGVIRGKCPREVEGFACYRLARHRLLHLLLLLRHPAAAPCAIIPRHYAGCHKEHE